MGHDEGVKNLKILIPALVLMVVGQVLLVRTFVGKANQDLSRVVGEVDTSLPHPSDEYGPKEAVQVILYALRHNDIPNQDAGLKAFWQFCTPRLKTLWRDKAMLRAQLGEDLWLALRDFDEYDLGRETVSDNDASFEITLRSKKRLERKVLISLKKIEDLWLVDMVAKKA